MAAANMVELLGALITGNNQERQQAETMYQTAKASEPDTLLLSFAAVLADNTVNEAVRQQAATLLRQCVTRGADKDFAFCRMNSTNKQQLAQELVIRFEQMNNPKLQKKVGDIIAKLADAATDDDQRGWFAPGQQGWPGLLQTMFKLANAAENSNTACLESSIRLLKDLVSVFQTDVVSAQQQLGVVIQNALSHSDPKIKCAAFVLVCELVTVLEKKAWAPLISTASVLTSVLQQFAQAQMQEELQECLQNYVEIASTEPDFFKQQIQSSMEPAKLLAMLVKTRQGLQEGVRNMALEWMVTYAEKKPKWLAKSVPSFPALVIECCMDLMLEVEDGDDKLKEWVERMDDEEGEEDADELYHFGEEAIDRVVEAIGMEAASSSLFTLVGRFSQEQAWQAKLAALTAIKQTVEYAEENEHVNEMAKLLLAHADHQHPRVRYAALHALGQLANDQAPQFQETWHATVMPVLLQKMDDPVDRVASMAMSAFVSFGEELENALMQQYAPGFMQKLVSRLQTTKHRMVQEESITSIAVIAGVIEKDFSQYYDGIMPMLKTLVMNAKGEKENRLRGKAFECMSLLGLAVGKEKFLPDAKEAVAAMLQTPMEADDLQREYITEASQRICKCLKADFAPFLPHLLPGLFKSLKLDAEDTTAPKPGDEDDDEQYITVSTGEGKLVKVRSSKFEELVQAVQLLNTYCVQMEDAFVDYVGEVAKNLLPLLDASDEVSMLCDEARSAAFQCWASLIKCARLAATNRGQPPAIANELLRTFLQKICGAMQKDEDPETLKDAAEGLAECLRNAGTGVLNGQEVVQLVHQLFQFIDASMLRTQKAEKEKQKDKAGAPPELQHDDDDEDHTVEDEDQCRRSLEDCIGAVMKIAPQDFLQCLNECQERISRWLGTKEHRALALFLVADLLEHLKDASEPTWPVCMAGVFAGVEDKEADVRIPAAYAMALAAPLPKFAQAAPEAFRKLAMLVHSPPPKKRDDTGKVAMDNCVAALFNLARYQSAHCPADIPAWQLVVNKLPLKDDEDEAKKLHKAVCELLLEQHAGLLGPDNAHLGKILSALAEVHKQEDLCEKETDAVIEKIFRMLPRENLLGLASGFTEKQQRKIEKMLC